MQLNSYSITAHHALKVMAITLQNHLQYLHLLVIVVYTIKFVNNIFIFIRILYAIIYNIR